MRGKGLGWVQALRRKLRRWTRGAGQGALIRLGGMALLLFLLSLGITLLVRLQAGQGAGLAEGRAWARQGVLHHSRSFLLAGLPSLRGEERETKGAEKGEGFLKRMVAWTLGIRAGEPQSLLTCQIALLPAATRTKTAARPDGGIYPLSPPREATGGHLRSLPRDWGTQPLVAIYHTHTGESYLPSAGKARLPGKGEIVAVGEALAQELRAIGIPTLHIEKVHDESPYHLAYTRSRETVRGLQKQYPSLRLFLDVHRDGIADPKTAHAVTTTVLGGEKVAKVMLYVGSDRGGKPFPNREEVLTLTQEVSGVLDRMYPGLVREVFTRSLFPHNQDLGKVLLVEFGDYRLNSKEEAIRAARYFARALATVLAEQGYGE